MISCYLVVCFPPLWPTVVTTVHKQTTHQLRIFSFEHSHRTGLQGFQLPNFTGIMTSDIAPLSLLPWQCALKGYRSKYTSLLSTNKSHPGENINPGKVHCVQEPICTFSLENQNS